MAVLRELFCCLLVLIFLQNARCFHMGPNCTSRYGWSGFSCNSSTICIHHTSICNGKKACPSGEDESDCIFRTDCSSDNYFYCGHKRICIRKSQLCDGQNDCGDHADESCERHAITTTTTPITTTTTAPILPTEKSRDNAEQRLVQWFLGRRRTDAAPLNRWGVDLHRTATALFLADSRFFSISNATGEEIRYELANNLLARLDSNRIPTGAQELALYVNALQAACIDPRAFYGRDLLLQLRSLSNSQAAFFDPFVVLVLCSAGATVSEDDVKRVIEAHDSTHRPFWTDVQALSVLALACLSEHRDVDERLLRDMGQELKKRQFRNGTVGNLHSTALVIQALTATDNLELFDVEAAIKTLVNAQAEDGSIGTALDSYYAMAALSGTSLLNVSLSHCAPVNRDEKETLANLLNKDKRGVAVSHSVWLGEDVDMGRTWRLRVPANSSCYYVLEMVKSLDRKHGVQYSVVEGKPFVSAAFGMQDDPERTKYWFTYVRHTGTDQVPVIFQESPADVILKEGEELILWYRAAQWGKNATKPIA